MYIENSKKNSRGDSYENTLKNKEKQIELYQNYIEKNNKFPEQNQVLIETRTDCNRRCNFCPQAHEVRPLEVMKWEIFERIIHHLAHVNFSGRIAFFITNEPLLDSRLGNMLSYAKKRCPRAFLDINTNGLLLTPSLLEALFKAGLDNINIEDYMSEEKYISGKKTSNIKEMLEGFKYNPKITYHQRKTNEVLSNRAGNVAKKSSARVESATQMFCYYPFKKLAVGVQGDVVICCMDYKYEVKFGNVMKENLFDIWHTERANQYRKTLLKGERKMFCENCDEGIYTIDTPGEEESAWGKQERYLRGC